MNEISEQLETESTEVDQGLESQPVEHEESPAGEDKDLEALIRNKKALKYEKKKAQAKAAELQNLLTESTSREQALSAQIDSLMTNSVVRDLMTLVRPTDGASGYAESELIKLVEMAEVDGEKVAQLKDGLTLSEVAEAFREKNKSIVWAIDSGGAGVPPQNSSRQPYASTKSAANKFGLR